MVSNCETFYGIMDTVSDLLASIEEQPLVVPIDQHFNVKGIGLVAIGHVQSGIVSVHDEVTMLPHGGTALSNPCSYGR